MFRTLIPAAGLMLAVGIGLAPIAGAAGPYSNCSQAKADGVCNITQDSLNYLAKLDRDSDGVACEC